MVEWACLGCIHLIALCSEPIYIFISTIFGHEKLDLHKMMIFLTVLNQVDTLKYDYISHYFLSRYTHTSVLTSMIMMVQFSCYGLNKLVPFYIKLQREGVGTPLAKLLYYYKEIHFLCQYNLLFFIIKVISYNELGNLILDI